MAKLILSDFDPAHELSTFNKKLMESLEDIPLTTKHRKELETLVKDLSDAGPDAIKGAPADKYAYIQKLTQHLVSIALQAGVYDNTLSNDETELAASIPNSNNDQLRSTVLSGNKLTGELSGPQAIYKIAAATANAGSTITFPLFASGFWITIVPPTPAQLSEIDLALINARSDIGKSTLGVSFTHDSTISMKHMVDLFTSLVSDCSIKNWDAAMLARCILSSEIHHIATMIASARYATGYPYTRICTVNPSECTHMEKVILSPRSMIRHVANRLPAAARAHMTRARKPSILTEAEVLDYQEKFVHSLGGEASTYQVENMIFHLRTPSIQKQIESGYAWYDDIQNTIAAALSTDIQGDARTSMINVMVGESYYRRISHWVHKLEFITDSGEETYTQDIDAITYSLQRLAADNESGQGLEEAYARYLDQTAITVVGTYNYQCPGCNQWQAGTEEKRDVLIPFDGLANFFLMRSR